MEAVANNSAFAKKAGVPQSVGKDFSAADKGRKFQKGGATMMSKKGPMKSSSKGGMPPAMMAAMMARKSPPMGEAPPDSMGMKKGGMAMKDGKPAFMQKKMNMGGMAKYAAGGSVGSASRRADGIAQRGKTKAKMV